MKYYFKLSLRAIKFFGIFSFIIRSTKLFFLIKTKKDSVFTVNFGNNKFQFKFSDRGKHKGGRGIFIFREKIEKLLNYGHIFINKGDTCIDGGANLGIYSLAFLSAVGEEGDVISIEPMPYAIDAMKNLVNLNKFDKPIIIEGAISNRSGMAELDFSDGVGFGSITRSFGGDEILNVQTFTIDEIISKNNISTLHFIKLDIEGAEMLALEGAQKSIAEHKPTICLECEEDRFEEITIFLQKYNYKPFFFNNNGLLININSHKIPNDVNQIFYLQESKINEFTS